MSAATPSHTQWFLLIWGESLSQNVEEKQSAFFLSLSLKGRKVRDLYWSPTSLHLFRLREHPDAASLFLWLPYNLKHWRLKVQLFDLYFRHRVGTNLSTNMDNWSVNLQEQWLTFTAFQLLLAQTKRGWHPPKVWCRLQASGEYYYCLGLG